MQASSTPSGSPGRLLAILLALVALVSVTFYAAPRLQFTTWDDQQNVVYNEYLSPLTPQNLGRFWDTERGFLRLYIPVTYTFYALETVAAESPSATLGAPPERNPRVYHLGNLALHLLTTVFVFLSLRLLVRNDWAAAAGALLFAVHPLQVESVAWVSETKGLLAACFGMFALWQYLLYSTDFERGEPTFWFNYLFATVAVTLAMLSKPSAVALPLVAAALDYGVLRRTKLRIALAIVPWLVIGLVVALVNRRLQAPATEELAVALTHRPLLALDAVAFYLLKLVMPLGLCTDYGRDPQSVLAGSWWWATALFPLGVLYFLNSLPQRRIWLTAAVVFLVALLPTLGLVSFEFQRISTVADRYAYLALLGPALALAWWLNSDARRSGWIATGVVLLILALFSSQQTIVWYDDRSLFTHAATVNDKSYIAHSKLGAGYFRSGDFERAATHYQRYLELRPDDDKAAFNLAQSLFEARLFDKALPYYRDAIAKRPKDANVYAMTGHCYLRMGDFESAEFEFNRALAVNPQNDIALRGLEQLREIRESQRGARP